MGDKNFKWWFSDSEDAEVFQGPFESRADAVSEGASFYVGEQFYVTEADKTVMSPYIDGDAYAERIMEDLIERNGECFGEDGPDDPWAKFDQPHRSLGDAIELAVSSWLASHPGKTWSFHDMRNGEYITPVAEDA